MFRAPDPDDDDPDDATSWFWRVMKASLPFQVALVAVICAAILLEPSCCDSINNLNLSLTPQLRYVRGPPPVWTKWGLLKTIFNIFFLFLGTWKNFLANFEDNMSQKLFLIWGLNKGILEEIRQFLNFYYTVALVTIAYARNLLSFLFSSFISEFFVG